MMEHPNLSRRTLLGIFLLAWIVRLAAGFAQAGWSTPESDLWLRAEHAVGGQGPVGWVRGVDPADPTDFNIIWQFSSVYRRPLPWLAFAPFAMLPASLQPLVYFLTTALSAATVVLACWFACRIAGRNAAFGTALIATCFPYQVFNSYHPYDTVFVAVGMMALAVCLLEWRLTGGWHWLGLGGLAAGWLLLARFSTPAMVGLMGLWLLAATPGGLVRRFLAGVALTTPALACCLPWVWYVQQQTGHWSMGPGIGKGLYWSYNPHTIREYPWFSIDIAVIKAWNDLPREYREAVASGALADFDANVPLADAAKAYIAAHPLEVLAKIPIKLASPWLPFSPWHVHPATDRVRQIVHGVSSYLLLGLGLVGLWHLGRRPGGLAAVSLLVLPWGAMFFTAVLMWAHSRERAVYDPFLMIPAGLTLAMAAAWLFRWITTHPEPRTMRSSPVLAPPPAGINPAA